MTKAYAAMTPGARLEPFEITRRAVGPRDIAVEIKYSGICHSDIHQAREEWAKSIFPMVPGHEIAGVVTEVGSEVTKLSVGDHAGVGVLVDSCRECANCRNDLECYCTGHVSPTYNGTEHDQLTPTYGGYSTHIVVDERFVHRIPASLPLDVAAPLLCAGITTYSPLKHWGAGPGKQVAVVGLGGLGHMGVQIAAAMGAEVTLISHSPSKQDDAYNLGAQHFLLSSDKDAMKASRDRFDFILNTASAALDMHKYLSLLTTDATMCNVGLPDKPISVSPFSLTAARRSLAGSNIGGMVETQEMLDFCGAHGLGAEVEVIGIQDVNEAWDRVVASDVRYRFVIDATSFDA